MRTTFALKFKLSVLEKIVSKVVDIFICFFSNQRFYCCTCNSSRDCPKTRNYTSYSSPYSRSFSFFQCIAR